MRPARVIAIAIAVVVLVALAASMTAAQRIRISDALFSEEPMERYLAEQIVLDSRISGARLDAPAALSSASWSAVVEMVGTAPAAPNGCDIYVRYFAGHPGVGDAADAPASAQAGFAVAHVKDPDEPSGPVSFRFPRDGCAVGGRYARDDARAVLGRLSAERLQRSRARVAQASRTALAGTCGSPCLPRAA